MTLVSRLSDEVVDEESDVKKKPRIENYKKKSS